MIKKYKDLLDKAKDSSDYWSEIFTLELIEDLYNLMSKKNISQKKLADLLGNSEAYISRVLNGYENLSINSIAKITHALDAVPHIHVAPKDHVVEWIERPSYTETVVLEGWGDSILSTGYTQVSVKPRRRWSMVHRVEFIMDDKELEYNDDWSLGNKNQDIPMFMVANQTR